MINKEKRRDVLSFNAYQALRQQRISLYKHAHEDPRTPIAKTKKESDKNEGLTQSILIVSVRRTTGLLTGWFPVIGQQLL